MIAQFKNTSYKNIGVRGGLRKGFRLRNGELNTLSGVLVSRGTQKVLYTLENYGFTWNAWKTASVWKELRSHLRKEFHPAAEIYTPLVRQTLGGWHPVLF